MTLQVPDGAADLPPASKLVLCILAVEDGLRHHEIRDRGQLPRGTVTNAIATLRHAGLVDRRPCPAAPSHYRYFLTDEFDMCSRE